MAHTVKADGNAVINLAPTSLIEEVIQNVTMILSTTKATAPLYRDFGLSARFLDKPTPATESMLIAELFDAIEKYEPRAQIINASFERDERTGKIIPSLEVEIHDI